MVGVGRVAIGLTVSSVYGYQDIIIIYLHLGGGVHDLDLLPDISVRHAVVVFILLKTGVAVDRYRRVLLTLKLVWQGRKRSEHSPFYVFKKITAAVGSARVSGNLQCTKNGK